MAMTVFLSIISVACGFSIIAERNAIEPFLPISDGDRICLRTSRRDACFPMSIQCLANKLLEKWGCTSRESGCSGDSSFTQ